MGNIILQKLIELLDAYKLLYKKVAEDNMPPETLSKYCEKMKGQDMSPADVAPDELACAETVSDILRHFIPTFPKIISTAELDKYLRKNYKQVYSPAPNLVVVSPTGGGLFKNGHAGIIGENNFIFSNNTQTGKLDNHWTVAGWAKYYVLKGKFQMNYYDPFSPKRG